MKITSFLAAVSLFSSALSLPGGSHDNYQGRSCKKPQIRKEWRNLSIKERKDYTRAINCLHSKPALLKGIYAGTNTRFEDFALIHKVKTPKSHLTGFFLPWHRLFLAEFEHVLQTECGYKGAQPYWDYTIDTATGNFTKSVIFDNDHGFGGNGPYTGYPALPDPTWTRWGGGCVDVGPFAGWKTTIGPGEQVFEQERCLIRNLNLEWQNYTTQEWENIITNQTNFLDMNIWLEGTTGKQFTIHAAGHFLVGGVLRGNGTGAEVWTANLEPMFYVHHTNLDRIWWEWQHSNPEYKWAIGGNLESRVPNTYGNDTLNGVFGGPMKYEHEIDLLGVKGRYVKARIGELLSTTGEKSPSGHRSPLCYVYEKSPKPWLKKGKKWSD